MKFLMYTEKTIYFTWNIITWNIIETQTMTNFLFLEFYKYTEGIMQNIVIFFSR